LKERLRQAIEYMNWFQPAWDELTEDEQFVLGEFYMEEDQRQTDAVHTFCVYLKIERSCAYNKKNRAYDRLTLLVYGKLVKSRMHLDITQVIVVVWKKYQSESKYPLNFQVSNIADAF